MCAKCTGCHKKATFAQTSTIGATNDAPAVDSFKGCDFSSECGTDVYGSFCLFYPLSLCYAEHPARHTFNFKSDTHND